tara:strand:- start:1159 stop:1986 length:828 start_codon:yes stop_codon:yes gene_type:complete
MLSKATKYSPDAFVPDMEDSVPLSEKRNARKHIDDVMGNLLSLDVPVIPRINSLDSGLANDDIKIALKHAVFGISVGKISSSADINKLSNIIAVEEINQGRMIGSTRLIVWIETSESIINVKEIANSSPRIVALAFGAEDYTNDMAINRRSDDSEILFARHSVAIAAKSANLLSLDTPYFEFKNHEGLKADVETARSIGFTGKFAIHPNQIEAINNGFIPSEEEIEYSKYIVSEYQKAVKLGKGAIGLDGLVIDVPVVKRAQAVIDMLHKMNSRG